MLAAFNWVKVGQVWLALISVASFVCLMLFLIILYSTLSEKVQTRVAIVTLAIVALLITLVVGFGWV